MKGLFNEDRRPLPRWRFFSQTESSEAHEFETPPPKISSIDREQKLADFCDKEVRWKSEPSWENALELVSSSVIHQREMLAIAAAEQIRDSEESKYSAKILAKVALARGRGDPMPSRSEENTALSSTKRVALLRKRVRSYPRNAIRYLDLALAYSAIGQNQQAKKAIDIALILAPDNRYVLRCASRFFTHDSMPDIALSILRKSTATKRDPWLLATELAVSLMIKKPPRNIGIARKLVSEKPFEPFYLSELNSSIATFELSTGAGKKSRKFYKASMIDPTENVTAQAQWASKKMEYEFVTDVHRRHQLAHEARALQYQTEKKWVEALKNCDQWGKDEIFSSRPFSHASFIAAVPLGDAIKTEEFSVAGLQANPEEEMLRNNLAVSLALQDRPDEADKEINKIAKKVDDDMEATLRATQGLIEYRKNNVISGREMYMDSILMAKEKKYIRTAVLASLFMCQEELHANTDMASEILSIVEKNITQTNRQPLFPEAEAMLERLKEFKLHNENNVPVSGSLRDILLLE